MSLHSAVGGRSTIGGVRVQSEPETRKPPRVGGFGNTRERDPRPPSYTGGNKIAWFGWSLPCRHASGTIDRTQALCSAGAASVGGDDERPKAANKVLFGDAMIDQPDHSVGPRQSVLDSQLIAIDHQEFGHRDKGSSLIT